jgi:hypothetical protein
MQVDTGLQVSGPKDTERIQSFLWRGLGEKIHVSRIGPCIYTYKKFQFILCSANAVLITSNKHSKLSKCEQTVSDCWYGSGQEELHFLFFAPGSG